jgi:putative endonuclease
MNNQKTGALGEEAAADAYQKRGFDVLIRNYRTPYGEIDLIASDGAYLVFCEVKARRGDAFGRPCEAVTKKKRLHILNCAAHYLSEHPTRLQPRFDVCEVRIKNGGSPESVHIIEDAFEQEGSHHALF